MPVKYGKLVYSEQAMENNPISKIDLEIVDIDYVNERKVWLPLEAACGNHNISLMLLRAT